MCSDNFSLRMGRSITDADRLSASYNLRIGDSETAQLFGFRDTTGNRAQSASLGWTRNIKTNVINSARLTFSRNRIETLPFFAFGTDVAGELGIDGTSDSPINFGPPNLTFTNFGDLTDGSPLLRRDQTFGISEGVTWVKGNHNLSIGGDYRWIQINTISEQNARGSFSFSGLATSAFDDQGHVIGIESSRKRPKQMPPGNKPDCCHAQDHHEQPLRNRQMLERHAVQAVVDDERDHRCDQQREQQPRGPAAEQAQAQAGAQTAQSAKQRLVEAGGLGGRFTQRG